MCVLQDVHVGGGWVGGRAVGDSKYFLDNSLAISPSIIIQILESSLTIMSHCTLPDLHIIIIH